MEGIVVHLQAQATEALYRGSLAITPLNLDTIAMLGAVCRGGGVEGGDSAPAPERKFSGQDSKTKTGLHLVLELRSYTFSDVQMLPFILPLQFTNVR